MLMKAIYDYVFADPPPAEFICLVCQCVAREPMQVVCCGKLYCKGCLTKQMKHFNECAHCRQEGKGFFDQRAELSIKALRVKCEHHQIGCKWTGEIVQLLNHRENCAHALLPCPNKCLVCPSSESPFQVPRKDLQRHLKDGCPNRLYTCPHCKAEGRFNDITTSHLTACPQVVIPCPNVGCNENLPQCDIADHRQKCIFLTVPCKYANIGCIIKPCLKDQENHEKNYQLHLHIAMETILRQEEKFHHTEKRLSKFENEQKLRKNFETFHMQSFTQYKKSGDEFNSPPFQTHLGGYKISLQIFANGNGIGKGTHTSVYVFLQKGDHDENLTWPFAGTVTIELLNQLADNRHHEVSIVYQQESNAAIYSRRVVDGDIAMKGYGLPKYIPHEKLLYKQAINCQYLKDDCLYFRVSYSSPKPWLVCTV